MEYRQDELLSKQGKIVTQMAEDLLSRKIDERVPSMQDYACLYDASVGTVQSAANYLQAEQFVDLASRGRLGAFIEAIDYHGLWSLARNRLIMGVLPLPYSRQLAGLATALRALCSTTHADANFRYIRGSSTRMQQLQANQCDWIVVSRFAAETSTVHGFDLETVFRLGQSSYTTEQVLLIRDAFDARLADGMRVGIDINSTDQAYLVRSITRSHKINYVDIEYQRGVELLLSGEIDATIWTAPDLPTTHGIHVLPIDHNQDWFTPLSEAVIMTRPQDEAVQHVLESVIDMESIKQIQGEVLTSQRQASY